MKKPVLLLLLLFAVSPACLATAVADRVAADTPLTGPLMGQVPPGRVAKAFAPGIVSNPGWDGEGVFSPDMQEFYFTTDGGGADRQRNVVGYRQTGETWVKFTEYRRRGEITFSPDGKRMHMAKGYKDRVEGGWSERKSIGPLLDNENYGIMRLSASAQGSYYFDNYLNDALWVSKIKAGERQAPVKMGPVFNVGAWTAHPFAAADESYLIWDSERDGGFGDTDLYISFKRQDGSWGPAINMGDTVNTSRADFFATVTPDGKYMLFNRQLDDNNTDVYWISAAIINDLRPQE